MDNPTDSPPLISLPESEHRPLSVRAKALVLHAGHAEALNNLGIALEAVPTRVVRLTNHI